jgi:2,3-bisphosphoglycerate-independent phosphoglycerate mutase
MKRKLLFLIADGMGDYPVQELRGLTPLEAAFTPNIDALAARGRTGLCATIPEECSAGSDIANMALLGYDPLRYHTGRGPIEASAKQLELDDDDLVYRLNLCTVTEFSALGTMVDYCAGHIETQRAAELIALLQRELEDEVFSFVAGMQYRHLLVQRGGAGSLEADIRINPPHDILQQPLDRDIRSFGRSDRLFRLVTEAASILAQRSPDPNVNAVWPWGQGGPIRLPAFSDRYGLSGGVVSAVDLVKGLGRAASLEVLEVPGATGLLDTDYEGKARAAERCLRESDFVYLHLEGPDECGHEGSHRNKIEAIERFDRRIVGALMPVAQELEAACVIACDHLTPVSVRSHTRDPVPFLFFDPRQRAENPDATFSERAAGRTGLRIEPGHELLPWVLQHMRD